MFASAFFERIDDVSGPLLTNCDTGSAFFLCRQEKASLLEVWEFVMCRPCRMEFCDAENCLCPGQSLRPEQDGSDMTLQEVFVLRKKSTHRK